MSFGLSVPSYADDHWKLGTPIVTYWAGPGYPGGGPLNDVAATQMKDGGFNLVWCSEKELDVAQRHGLRGQLTDTLLNPVSLDDPTKREALMSLIDRVKKHPALYSYHILDEPSASQFPALGKLVAFLRERDPKHLAYINLFPTEANNEQLGVKGDKTETYREYLRQYVETVKPSMLSYDHYQFKNGGDDPYYFLNLALMREKSLQSGIPFLNIVQASNWVPNSSGSPRAPRVPNGDELTYLVWTTLAYGAQGISYYVYGYPGHEGGIVSLDGTPTTLYETLKKVHPTFVSIASAMQKLKPLNVYHLGMQLPGTIPMPAEIPISFTPAIPDLPYNTGDRVQGLLVSEFGNTGRATHILIVNLDYKTDIDTMINCSKNIEMFDANSGKWIRSGGKSAKLHLYKGTGQLIRLK